jgi:hypothetical protein
VITAAHCLDQAAPRGDLEVAFGASADGATAVIVVAGAQVYSGYDPSTGDGDVAALLLAADAPVAPIAAPTGGVADVAAGGALRAVGFGVTSPVAGDPGVKREGAMQLGAVRAASFDATPAPAMTCAADSGGPVFATIASAEQLVGVTSRGDAACAATATNARYDVVKAPFVDPFAQASASAPAGWPAGLTSIDQLAAHACATDDECPALMTCLDEPAGRRCGFHWLGAGAFGAACADDATCGPSGRCARVWPDGADACHCFASSTAPPGPDAAGPPPPGDTGCCGAARGSPGWLAIAIAITAARRRGRSATRARAA